MFTVYGIINHQSWVCCHTWGGGSSAWHLEINLTTHYDEFVLYAFIRACVVYNQPPVLSVLPYMGSWVKWVASQNKLNTSTMMKLYRFCPLGSWEQCTMPFSLDRDWLTLCHCAQCDSHPSLPFLHSHSWLWPQSVSKLEISVLPYSCGYRKVPNKHTCLNKRAPPLWDGIFH